jgi:Divergent InlB B-repeat domain
MSDFGAGREADARAEGSGPWNGGSPPPVLLAALGAALLIAVTLVALVTSGGDDVEPLPDGGAAGAQDDAPQRVLLTVSLEGSGRGRIRIAPGDVSCSRSCERRFTRGARLVATADASSGSTFEGWGDGCDDGDPRCLFVMDGERSLTATFEDAAPPPQPAETDPLCEDDPACADGAGEPDAGRPAPSADCQDGRDNDGDGLTDAAQDPGCTERGSEAGGGTPPPGSTTAPAPPAANECGDRRDNDGDGLIDTAQDPGCEADRTEAG